MITITFITICALAPFIMVFILGRVIIHFVEKLLDFVIETVFSFPEKLLDLPIKVSCLRRWRLKNKNIVREGLIL